MKKLFFLIFFSGLMVLNCLGQDWQPVKLKLQSYYADAFSILDSSIVNSIYVDSVKIDNPSGDSVFYINHLTYDCDTCGDAVKITNQPHFLKCKMIKHSDQVFEFLDPGQMILYVNKPVGFSWVYDSIHNLSAEITSKYQESFFGIYDSVININLQDWGDITLSKNYGILYYGQDLPDIFFLIGTDHPQMGKKVLKYDDIFNFQAGDIHQYENIIYGYDPSYGTHSSHSIQKEKILSKTSTKTSISYFVKTLKMNWEENWMGIPGDTSFSQSYDTLVYTNKPWLAYNCIPGSACRLNNTAFFEDNIYSIPMATTDEYGNRVKMFGPGLNYIGTDFYLYDEATNYLYNYGIGEYYKYTEDFGYEYYTILGEIGKERFLMAYVRNGDTTGNIIPDNDFLVGISENIHSNPSNPVFYPNPARDFVYLKLPEITQKNLTIQVYDLQGKLIITEGPLRSQSLICINIGNLPEGLYIFKIISPGKVYSQKLLIDR